MIDVEHGSLRAFEQNAFAGASFGVKDLEGRGHERQNFRRDREEFLANCGGARQRQAQAAAQGNMVREQAIDLVVQCVWIVEVHQADRASRDLVLVSWADAALGRADLGSGDASRLAMRVEFAMQRQNQGDVLGDLEVGGRHFDALGAQLPDLFHEMVGIKDDAVADDGKFAGPNNPGRKQRKLVDLAVDHERMAGVMAALETDHDVGSDR